MDLADVRAVILADHPELAETIAERQEWGVDKRDEVWEGRYVVAPDPTVQHGLVQVRLFMHLTRWAEPLGLCVSLTFNLGPGPQSFRIPDLGIHQTEPRTIFVPTALVAIEVRSPKEKKREKFGYYAGRGVGEVWVAEQTSRTIEVYVLTDGFYAQVDASPLLGVSAIGLAEFPWPAV